MTTRTPLAHAATVAALALSLIACSDPEPADSSAKAPPEQVEETQTSKPTQWVDVALSNRASESALPAQTEEATKPNEAETFFAEDAITPSEMPTDVVSLAPDRTGYIEWQAPQDQIYSRADIQITDAAGNQRTLKFNGNESMILNETLPDGLYQWESVVTPSIDPYASEQLRAARESGNTQQQTEILRDLRQNGLFPSESAIRNNRQSGTFVVRNGVAVPTSTVGKFDDAD